MATPMSAALTAGASFTPSPVMAAMLPWRCRLSTILSLCSGATRAYTETSEVALSSCFSSIESSSSPVSALPPCSMMPRSEAMRAAVSGWSPVIMTVRTPARCASATASRTSTRGGSMMPTMPVHTSWCSITSACSEMSETSPAAFVRMPGTSLSEAVSSGR